jgi:hypothetical protein
VTAPQHVRAGKLIRLLASDHPGEVAAAARALHRVIAACGRDFHWMAEIVTAALDKESPTAKADGLEWHDVDAFTLHRHKKPGGRATLCITYYSDQFTFRDWLALEHDGLAREIAGEKWLLLDGATPVPRTVAEALERRDELDADIEIAVKHDGRYWQVIGQRARQAMPA